ncbi:alpha/beta fold hydrolase [Simkania negevensis]|uniref:Hydrolase, alpha/beta fold family n=1 Tax=Simkania negevensis (strain ATCC VR-1471 / DSM 27360 / Z) TaxID=331113 RepID=F8L9H9_SIMNZ|nr:alpha/beta hydrolase [Simkania negevensis]CCB89516.1 hydrolase, alpha/beta fold family [Simkania negevensis Z]
MIKWRAGVCKINGINIHYQRTGGHKPPVVLLHGLMTNGTCWTSLARVLEEDFDVIMPDSRGHGNSSAPKQGYSYDNLATDVLGLIEALEIAPPVLIGHSMGGMTAAVAASQNPEQLRGVVLADPTFLPLKRQVEVYESGVVAQHQKILDRSFEDFLSEMRIRHSHRSQELIQQIARARFQTSIHAFEILKPPNPDYIKLIKTLDLPSLLLRGGIGAIVSTAVAEELTCLNHRLEIVQIEEAGHGIPYDQPERFAEVSKTFLCSI